MDDAGASASAASALVGGLNSDDFVLPGARRVKPLSLPLFVLGGGRRCIRSPDFVRGGGLRLGPSSSLSSSVTSRSTEAPRAACCMARSISFDDCRRIMLRFKASSRFLSNHRPGCRLGDSFLGEDWSSSSVFSGTTMGCPSVLVKEDFGASPLRRF